MDNILIEKIVELNKIIKQYIEFQGNSTLYKEVNTPEELNELISNMDIMYCIEEEITANTYRQAIERSMNSIEVFFKEVDTFKLVYTSLKNHYLSLILDKEYEREVHEEINEDVEDDIEILTKPELEANPNMYGA